MWNHASKPPIVYIMYVLLQSLQFLLSVPMHPTNPHLLLTAVWTHCQHWHTGDDIFDWVEVSDVTVHSCHVTLPPSPQKSGAVGNSKSPDFVHALATAICSVTVSGECVCVCVCACVCVCMCWWVDSIPTLSPFLPHYPPLSHFLPTIPHSLPFFPTIPHSISLFSTLSSLPLSPFLPNYSPLSPFLPTIPHYSPLFPTLSLSSPLFPRSLPSSPLSPLFFTIPHSLTSVIYNDVKRATVLKKYVDEDRELQVEILYALQVVITKLEHPPVSSCGAADIKSYRPWSFIEIGFFFFYPFP